MIDICRECQWDTLIQDVAKTYGDFIKWCTYSTWRITIYAIRYFDVRSNQVHQQIKLLLNLNDREEKLVPI